MSLSQLARSIAESPTLRLNEEARLLRERGEPVIHLGIGEPKNKAPLAADPEHGRRSSTRATSSTRPTDGMPSLKKAIIRYTEENYDRLVAPENVIVSSGREAVALQHPVHAAEPAGRGDRPRAVLGQLSRDDQDVLRRAGHRHARRTARSTRGSQDIERAVSPSTKAIIVNSPNNPSGVMYSEQFIAEIVEFCERRGICVMMDDIYHKLSSTAGAPSRPTGSPSGTSSDRRSSSSTASPRCTG